MSKLRDAAFLAGFVLVVLACGVVIAAICTGLDQFTTGTTSSGFFVRMFVIGSILSLIPVAFKYMALSTQEDDSIYFN